MTTTYHWLKQLPTSTLEMDDIPLFGHPPPFPWEELSKSLQQNLSIENLTIEPAQTPEWRTEKELLSGLSDNVIPLNLSIAPLNETLCWVMAKQDIDQMISLFLGDDASQNNQHDPEFLQGFYRFITLEVINTINSLNFDKEISPQILTETALPHETALTLDIAIKFPEKTFWGRLILPETMRKKWKERYSTRSLEIPLSKKINLTLHAVAGRVKLTPHEWEHVKLGDFIILDSCSVNPDGTGRVKLSIDSLNLFDAELVEQGMKLLEFSEHQEGEINMDEEEENHDDHIDDEDEEYDDENDEDFEDIDEDATESDEEDEEFDEEDENHDEFTHPEEGLEETEVDNGEEGEEGETNEEENFEFEDMEQEKWPPPPEKRPEQAAVTKAPPPEKKEEVIHVDEEAEEEAVSLSTVPLSVVVEVARLQLSLQKIIELQPGNLLDLKIHPENGVDLVVNGKRIAKGELMLIGETLGVRILDIG